MPKEIKRMLVRVNEKKTVKAGNNTYKHEDGLINMPEAEAKKAMDAGDAISMEPEAVEARRLEEYRSQVKARMNAEAKTKAPKSPEMSESEVKEEEKTK